jgi:formiminotetrahydrofolate cyclodeaminase
MISANAVSNLSDDVEFMLKVATSAKEHYEDPDTQIENLLNDLSKIKEKLDEILADDC